ncbi:MAG: YkgJ family cysteine cluster protein [Bacteroidota bacterium]
MIKNPDILRNNAKSRKKEFKHIVKKIRNLKSKQIDILFHSFHDDAFSKINCLECANCCRGLGPRITLSDIKRLAAFLKIKEADFMQKYITSDEDDDYVFQQIPCPFLMEDNYCSVYPARPKACRQYPHTNQKNIKSILPVCLENTQICPAVYHIFNLLKI